MTALSRRDWLKLSAAVAALAPLPIYAAAAPDSLNTLAAAKGLRFGSCMGTGPSGAPRPSGDNGARANQFDDSRLRELFARECGVLVPENELKWYAIRPNATDFDFARADRLMGFVAANGLLVRGHTLLWNRDVWMPAWTQSYDFGPQPRAEAERLLTEHIAKVAGRYPQIFSWDVVNETIDPKTGEMEPSVFTRHIGPEVIDIAFHAARAAAPKAELVYNDYMSWGPGNAVHRAAVLKLLERLKTNNGPVDALGVQAHIGPGASDSTNTLDGENEREWRQFLDAVTAMGLDVIITELDYGDTALPGDVTSRNSAVSSAPGHSLEVKLSCPRHR